MPKEKYIWTVNKNVYDEDGDLTYRSEHAYEILSDALKFISVWSNMKTNIEKLEVTISNDGLNRDETTFVANKTNEHGYKYIEEEVILQKITLKLKNEEES